MASITAPLPSVSSSCPAPGSPRPWSSGTAPRWESPDEQHHFLEYLFRLPAAPVLAPEHALAAKGALHVAPPGGEDGGHPAARFHQVVLVVPIQKIPGGGEEVDYFYDTAKAAGVELTSSSASVHIHADQPLFRRALSNLITNALAHTPAGGSVTVTAARGAAGVSVTVTDTGCGVAAEHLPRLFDRFYQVERETGKESVGSGLGLAIVKVIMTMHGGSAAIESTPGQGTSAILQFQHPLAVCAGRAAA